MPSSTHLIVGLGNPGIEHAGTRHNIGFMVADALFAKYGRLKSWGQKFKGAFTAASTGEKDFFLLKPQTFMNLSGQAVSCLLAKHKCDEPGDQLIVISDDLALPLGKIRIRERGSAGGHNGLKSIIAAIGTNEFVRLRIGIQPEHPVSDTKRFVLDAFPKTERPTVDKTIERGVEALRAIIRDGVLKAMTEHN